MMLSITEILESINGSIYIDGKEYNYSSVETDTRKLKEECIFVALKGNNFNGNDFVINACNKGAKICIVDEIKFDAKMLRDGVTVIKVDDTGKALLDMAEAYRKKLNLKVIGITGSTGKTSTKDLTAAFLSDKYKVFKTKGNFNNAIGLPLMIFQIDESYDVAVLEMGMSALGEIHTLTKVCRPDIAIITNIGISHIENLKTRENILKAKMEITDFFNKDNMLIINNDNDMLKTISNKNFRIKRTSASGDTRSDIRADKIKSDENGIEFDVFTGNEYDGHLSLPVIGIHNVDNALLAYGAAKAMGLTIEEMQNGVCNIECTSMRLDVTNAHGMTIIDDSYNASPDSMKAAINASKSFRGRKVAILGTMRELGYKSSEAHEEVGKFAKENGVDFLIVIGEYSDDYMKGYGSENFTAFDSLEDAECGIGSLLRKGDVILVKASRSMHFENIVRILK